MRVSTSTGHSPAKEHHHHGLLATALAVAVSSPASADNPVDILIPGLLNNAVFRYDQDGGFLETFIAPGAGGLSSPHGMTLGPDGNVYVGSFNTDQVLRFDGGDGAFIDVFADGPAGILDGPTDCAFGADGALYVTSFATGSVERYDGVTGAHLGSFVPAGTVPQMFCEWLRFGPDGQLYVSSGPVRHSIVRFDGQSGAVIDEFVMPLAGGLLDPHGFDFGPDGNLYVASFQNHNVLRFNGQTGAFIDEFIAASSGGLTSPHGLDFGPDGNLYVTSWATHEVLRYDGPTGTFIDVFISGVSGGLFNPTLTIFRPPHSLPCPEGAGAGETGDGCTGSNGLVPALCVSGCPTPGGDVVFAVSDGIPNQTTILFFGVAEAQLPMGFGCFLLTAPLLPLQLALPLSGSGDLMFPAPVPPGTPAVTLVTQAFVVDPADPAGFSNSNGIRIEIR